jgi:hypothetical protein
MTTERWHEIMGQIKDNFDVKDSGIEHLDEQGGVDIEFIEFQGPLGLMRLELESRPVVSGKKTTYSNRIGSQTAVEYQYSETEKVYELFAFKWDEAQEVWVDVEAKSFE